MDIQKALSTLNSRISSAVARRGAGAWAPPLPGCEATSGVMVVAASKYVDAAAIMEAARAGVRVFGENRVQDLREKAEFIKTSDPELFSKIEFHMIGHLQSNKVRDAVAYSSMIQSVDSAKLASRISEYAVKFEKTVDLLIEVKTSSEETKSGAPPEEVLKIAEGISGLKNVRLRGLMTMSELSDDPAVARRCFEKAFELFLKLRDGFGCDALSMGMSDDLETAVECGATLVRPGRVLFM